MKTQKEKRKRVLLIAGVAFAVLVGLMIVSDFVLDKVADRVIDRLSKDYSPSPYGPGLDPDKVPMTKIHNRFEPD